MTREKARTLRGLIEQASVSLPDEDALDGIELFPAWKPGERYLLDKRLRYSGKLWRVLQPELTASEIYPPGAAGTEALYAEIAKPGQGDSPDNPIHYDNNMELVEGKYYEQGGIVYVCFRSTGIPVYNDLSDLVGIYVKIWEVD